MSEIIDKFTGEYRFLSNFWPVEIEFDDIIYPSVEHAYVAAKTLDFVIRRDICQIKTASEVKKFGRKIQLRSDWEKIKFSIMSTLVRRKFFLNDELQVKLINTYPVTLIEGNHWGDVYWGICNGKGENNLGKILMSVREECLYFGVNVD